jgi:carboxyl-terminal processing protease
MKRLWLALLFAPTILLSSDSSDGISLEKLGAMLEAARLMEQANGGQAVDVMELIQRGDAAVSNDLDPYSGLLDTDRYREARIQHRGEFVGIGITYQHRRDHLLVRDTIANGPAAKAGIMAGDRIVKVAGEPVSSLGRGASVERIRGKSGTEVQLTVQRKSAILTMTATRGRVELPAISPPRMLDGNVGYLQISRFHGRAEKQIVEACDKLFDAGMRRLLVDLRGNPGGSTDAAIRIAGLFLQRGTVIAFEVRDGEKRKPIHTRNDNRRLGKVPLVCLVDGRTASASEILAGALQSNGRARLVGQRTFGKGVGQETTRLLDGSAVKLTKTAYFTPTGDPIHAHGLQPDFTVEDRDPKVSLETARRLLLKP